MQPNSLQQTTYRAGLVQSKAHRSLTTFMNGQLKPAGITLPEWAVIGLLVESGEQRPADIAQALAIKPPVATRVLAKLEAKGFLERADHAHDSRATTITLTAAGRQRAAELERRLRGAMKQFLSDITPVQLAVYLAVMEKIAAKA
jgi:DNA-binding MarR family transcriptional regulator